MDTLKELEYSEDEWSCLIRKEFCKENIETQIRDIIDNLDIKRIKDICDQIVNALKVYYNGFSGEAYKIIENLMQNNYEYLDFMKFDEIKFGLTSISNSEPTIFYKIRPVKKDEILLDKKELFHIPFNKREEVGSSRYSINGYPCIYMGKSIDVCWNECDKPQHFYLTAIDISKLGDRKFLIFSDEPCELASKMEDGGFHDENAAIAYLRFFEKYLYTFPILAACSCIVCKTDGKFKPEYIIPNILTQYIREKTDEFQGIIYFSCKSCDDIYGFMDNINIVIPTTLNEDNMGKYSKKLGEKMMFSKINAYDAKTEEDIKKIKEQFKIEELTALF